MTPTRIIQSISKLLSARGTQFIAVPALVLSWFAFTDPSPDAGDTVLRLQLWAQALIITGLAYLVSKALAGRHIDAAEHADLAKFGNTASAIVYLGILVLRGAIFAALLGFFSAQVRATEIPTAARSLLPQLQTQIQSAWPGMPEPAYIAALIEHESCITLTHPRCWQPTARLRTPREEGAGLGQLTRAWAANGTLRFDALAEARRLDPRGLADLNWSTIYSRPDLQMRAITLTVRALHDRLQPLVPGATLDFVDAAYNGGLGGLLNERRACAASPGCDPGRWWGHVESHCLKSRRPLYAGRSACDINRHHVADVRLTRQPRYTPWLAPRAV